MLFVEKKIQLKNGNGVSRGRKVQSITRAVVLKTVLERLPRWCSGEDTVLALQGHGVWV